MRLNILEVGGIRGKMKANLECIPCFMRQALQTSRLATTDERLQEKSLKAVAKYLSEIDFRLTPPQIGHKVHEIIRRETENEDPYFRLKKRDNDLAIKFMENFTVSENILESAIKLAIVGNIVDYGAIESKDIDFKFNELMRKDFAVNDFVKFKKDLSKSENIVYLADNAGELVFDKFLIKQFKGKNITVYVKGGPILNDALIMDAEYVGLDKLCKIDYLGNGVKGTGPERWEKSFRKKLEKADLVISKGQGNYEGLSDVAGIYFLLMAKCPQIAEKIGVELKSLVFFKGMGK